MRSLPDVTVDDVVDFILANAPNEGEKVAENPFKGHRFDYELVEQAVAELHSADLLSDLEIFDIHGTKYMWNTKAGIANHQLARKATKQLLNRLQEENPDKKLEEILPTITKEAFHTKPINKYGTTLIGMITKLSGYNSSPYKALKDLIDNDEEYMEQRDFQPYDMSKAPVETWQGEEGKKIARTATKQLLKKLQEENPDKKLEQILPTIAQKTFFNKAINKYGTTLGGMLGNVPDYKCSPYIAVKDLIDNDEEYAEYRDMQPYDMDSTPLRTWQGEEGKKIARTATKQLLKKLQEENPDKKLEEIIPTITVETFKKKAINKYGTTLGGMLTNVISPGYKGSPYHALKDLAENEDEYKRYLPVIESRLRHRAA